MDNVYIKVHRYDADETTRDSYSVTTLSFDKGKIARDNVRGLFNPDRLADYIGTLDVDEPVNILSVLVSDEIRNYVCRRVIPIEWQKDFLENKDLYSRVMVYFTAAPEQSSWLTPEAREVGMRTFIEQLAKKGLSADLQPTMLFGQGEEALYKQFCEYLQRLDENLKASAGETLAFVTA